MKLVIYTLKFWIASGRHNTVFIIVLIYNKNNLLKLSVKIIYKDVLEAA